MVISPLTCASDLYFSNRLCYGLGACCIVNEGQGILNVSRLLFDTYW